MQGKHTTTVTDISAQTATAFSDDALPLDELAAANATIIELKARITAQEQRIRELASLCETDELTGLLNRRGFEAAFRRSLAEANRYAEDGVLAFIDLDSFKQVNDGFGHEAGDELLRRVSDLLREQMRRTDTVARIGGDEFALILPRADYKPTLARVAELNSVLNTATATIAGADIRILASIGVQKFGPGSTYEETMRRADAAMYDQKRRRALSRGLRAIG